MKLTEEMKIYIERIIERDNFYRYRDMPRDTAIELIISNALAKYQQTAYPDKQD